MIEQDRYYWFFNLIGMVAAGLFIGFLWQILQDSGEKYFDRIIIAMLNGGGSFLLAFFLIDKQRNSRIIPKEVLMVTLGAIFYFLIGELQYIGSHFLSCTHQSLVGYKSLYDLTLQFLIITLANSVIGLVIIGMTWLLAILLLRSVASRMSSA